MNFYVENQTMLTPKKILWNIVYCMLIKWECWNISVHQSLNTVVVTILFPIEKKQWSPRVILDPNAYIHIFFKLTGRKG